MNPNQREHTRVLDRCPKCATEDTVSVANAGYRECLCCLADMYHPGTGHASNLVALAYEEQRRRGEDRDGNPLEDEVNAPSHYRANGIEVLDVIEAFELGYRLGNVAKYILRAGRKDSSKHIQDLEKARFYLDREIAALKGDHADD